MYYYGTVLNGSFIRIENKQRADELISSDPSQWIIIESPTEIFLGPPYINSENAAERLTNTPYTIYYFPPEPLQHNPDYYNYRNALAHLHLGKAPPPPKKGFAAWINTLESK